MQISLFITLANNIFIFKNSSLTFGKSLISKKLKDAEIDDCIFPLHWNIIMSTLNESTINKNNSSGYFYNLSNAE